MLALGVMAGIGWAGHFVLEKLERRQSRQLAAAAAQNLVEGRVREAQMALETATRLDPGNTRALRLLAQVQGAQGSGAEALETMGRLAGTGGLTRRDLFDYFALAMREEEFAVARRVADAAANGDDRAKRHLLLARLEMRANKPAEAERELREAAAVDRSGRARLELAKFLLGRGLTPETKAEVLESLRDLSQRPDALGAEALTLGLSTGVVPLVEREGWITALRSQSAVGDSQRLAADRAEAQLHPGKKGEVARNAARRLAGRPLLVRVEALAWAMDIGENQTALEFVEPAEALEDAGVFTMWLTALDRAGNASGAPALFEKSRTPLPAWLLGLFQARALREQGQAERGREACEQALDQARANPLDFRCAVVFLGAFGDQAQFESALREALVQDPGQRQSILSAVMPAVFLRREAASTLRVYEIAAEEEGGFPDPVLQNERDHLALLLGRAVDLESVAQRSREHPANFVFRATHALALLRENRGEEALQLLENCEPDVVVAALLPRQKVVVIAALAANGRVEEAKFFARQIPSQALFREESALLTEQFAKAAAAPRIPNSTAGFRPKPKPAEEAAPALEGIPNPTQKAIEEALQNLETDTDAPADSTQRAIAEALESVGEGTPATIDATQKILQEARKEVQEAAASGEAKK